MESIERTFYDHFCGGRNLGEADTTAKRLWENSGLRAMLDYGMEHAIDNASCDENMNEFIQTIESTQANRSTSPVSYSPRDP